MDYYNNIASKDWYTNNSDLNKEWIVSSSFLSSDNIFIYYFKNILCKNCYKKKKNSQIN